MTVCGFKFSALDTLMFRDGKPFNQNDAGAASAQSVFPPPPPTVVGAIRMMLWTELTGNGLWPKDKLGDGVNWQSDKNILDPLSFDAALLAREENGTVGTLFPAPAHLASAKRKDAADGREQLVFLRPERPFCCDLGTSVFLPSAPEDFKGIKSRAGSFLTEAGMRAVLNGKVPRIADTTTETKGDIVPAKDLFSSESRVGIARDTKTRSVIDGALYTAAHTRPADDLVLVQRVHGLPPDLARTPVLQRFGGEHRVAEIAKLTDVPALPAAPSGFGAKDADGFVHYAAIALSPVVLDTMPMPGEPVPGLNGSLVSACMGKPVMIGGWDTVNGLPLPMRAALPAGSVFFMKVKDAAAALQCHGGKAGKFGEWGFGQVLVARWKE